MEDSSKPFPGHSHRDLSAFKSVSRSFPEGFPIPSTFNNFRVSQTQSIPRTSPVHFIQVNLCQKLLFLHQLTYDDRFFIELQVPGASSPPRQPRQLPWLIFETIINYKNWPKQLGRFEEKNIFIFLPSKKLLKYTGSSLQI